MTRRLPRLFPMVTAAMLALSTWVSAKQQTFRASADVVIVDVSVRQGGQHVPGLTAGDFVVLDNGVRQEIERVEATSVPIDLTIVTDVSYKHTDVMNTLRTDLAQIGGTLRPSDRIRVFAFDDHVRQVVPFQLSTAPITLSFVPGGHQASLIDAIIIALATPVEPHRRHVVIVRTRGTDTMSLTAVARLQDVAASSDAQLHIILDEMTVWEELEARGFQCAKLDRCLPTFNFWQPRRHVSQVVSEDRLVLSPFGLALQDAAVGTGGAIHVTQVLNPPTVRSTFEKVFALFRESYVLRYVPKGVTRDGWHSITVTTPAHRRAVVRARRGYGIDPPVHAGLDRLWLAPDMSKELRRLVTTYDARQYAEFATVLGEQREFERLFADVRDAANPWPAEPWREAVFALELAESVLFSPYAAARKAGLDLLRSHTRLVRSPLEPDDFERYWYWAVVSVAEGTLRALEMRHLVDQALLRFPDEPRFVLARAISADQEWSFGQQSGSFRGVIEPMYRHAMTFAETDAEARIRLAWGLHRQGAHTDALALLTAAPVSAQDRSVAYLRDLFAGHCLVSLQRYSDAIASFRRADAVLPGAHAARVALMNALMLSGAPADRIEAEALAETIQTRRTSVADPWWTYWQGDYRLYPSLIQHLRERRR